MEEKEENLYRRKRNIMLIGITFCIVFFLSFLSGCGVNELENQAFPLVMGVESTGKLKAFSSTWPIRIC